MGRGRRATAGRLHGVIVIDKPAGWTSHDVVARVRRLTGERRVGHAGTLDPAATGVLPVVVGDATKVVEFLADAAKGYRAEITFGVSTDSHDGDGLVTSTGAGPIPDRPSVLAALAAMVGPQWQTPPMHSAIRIDGERLYEAARRGETVDRDARPVTFHRLDLLDWSPPVATVDVDCSKGTYIRSLAHDLGEMLGCGAHLSDLVRTRTGGFDLRDAWTLDDLGLAMGEDGDPWEWIAIHPDRIVESWPAATLDPDGARGWDQGRPVAVGSASGGDGPVRTYGSDGTWLGVGRRDGDVIRPWKVIRRGDE